jgi:hypothetical protein
MLKFIGVNLPAAGKARPSVLVFVVVEVVLLLVAGTGNSATFFLQLAKPAKRIMNKYINRFMMLCIWNNNYNFDAAGQAEKGNKLFDAIFLMLYYLFRNLAPYIPFTNKHDEND